MDVKKRNEIADYIAEHIERVGLDEPIEEILRLFDLAHNTKKHFEDLLDINKDKNVQKVAEHRKLVSQVRLETIGDIISILTGKEIVFYENEGKIDFIKEEVW